MPSWEVTWPWLLRNGCCTRMINSYRMKFSTELKPKFLVQLNTQNKFVSHLGSKFPWKQSCAWIPLKILHTKLLYYCWWYCYSIPKYSYCANNSLGNHVLQWNSWCRGSGPWRENWGDKETPPSTSFSTCISSQSCLYVW